MPEFLWINTILGNLKTSFGGAYHAFDFAKDGSRYLAGFAYRFNRRFQLNTLSTRLLVAAVARSSSQMSGFGQLKYPVNQVILRNEHEIT